MLELDELAVSFLPEDDEDELESLLDSLFDSLLDADSDDFDSEPDDSLPLLLPPDFDDRLSVL